MNLYKRHRSTFGEIFFVVSGTKSEMTADTCQYENVLCIQYEDLAFSNPQDMETVVVNLTNKISARFEVCQLFASLIYSNAMYYTLISRCVFLYFAKYFFGNDFFSHDKVISAGQRLDRMTKVAASLVNEPFSVSDPKYGIHGGLLNHPSPVSYEDIMADSSGTLFYCGGAHGHLQGRTNFRYSTFGLFLAKSLFPEFKGSIELIQPGDQIKNTAIPLTEDSIKRATKHDFLIVHSHQFCEVSVNKFPGTQLHINVSHVFYETNFHFSVLGLIFRYFWCCRLSIMISTHSRQTTLVGH